MTFKWTKDMRIDDGQIDADHKKLISIANKVLTLEQSSKRADELKQLIQDLYEYVKYHFAREEDLMQKLEYPDMKSHQTKHENIILAMNLFLANAQNMDEILVNFRKLVSKWVIDHIMDEDKKLQRFMDAKVKAFLKKD
ncbi:MAG: hemerythrin family protein [Candidatus Marinimicrobia bacterium]|nr:hemerythrin family protein [Candidatus Neomarinimicrobiota bacterium]